jgi:hypothetical protein
VKILSSTISRACAVAVTGTAVTALSLGGASAAGAATDNYKQFCSGYQGNSGVNLCISYDYTDGELAVNAYNDNAANSAFLSAALSLRVQINQNYNMDQVTQNEWAGKTWWGNGEYWGAAPGANVVCGTVAVDSGALIDAICANFYVVAQENKDHTVPFN